MSTTQALVRELRALGLSQTEISRRTGIPQSRLSRWEAGVVPTGADDALSLQRLHAELSAGAPPVATEEGANAG